MRISSKSILLCAFLFYFGIWQAHSFYKENPFDSVEQAIREGNAQKLLTYLAPFVDITLDGVSKTYSKAQTETVLRQFFRQHPAVSFSIVHTGRSNKGSQYAVGRYESSTTHYSVLVKAREVKKKALFYEIRFIAG